LRWARIPATAPANFSSGWNAITSTGTLQGNANWNQVLLLRMASNFDMPPSGTTPAQSLESERHGAYTAYLPALEAAYAVGHRVVAEWLK
jgi:purine nucleoside permease